jgi:hypothetical protein
MISCPNCKYQEYSGALYCSQCGSQIFTSANNTTAIGTSEIKDKPGISPTPPPFPTPPLDFQNCNLVIFLIDAGEIIFAENKPELTIGRSTEGQIIVPNIDLSPYDAYECGVSRLHANISINGNQITAKDLGSANGTRLNGKKLSANAEHTLQHGDILTLGKLKIQILIKE